MISKKRRSYAELLRRPEAAAAARLLGSASDVGPADVFVSHAWKYLFADLVAAIDARVKAAAARSQTAHALLCTPRHAR